MTLPLIAKVAVAALLGSGALMFAAGSKAHTLGPVKTMPPDLEREYQRAKLAVIVDPKLLSTVAAKLKAAGFFAQAKELLDLLKTRQIAESPHASPAEKITASAVSAVAQMQAQTAPPPKAALAPSGAVKVTALQAQAKKLSDHLNLLVKSRGSVTRAKGKEDRSLVQSFQSATGLKADGLYGPKTALMLGQSYGDVPIVFYWPKNTQPTTAVPTYRSNLETLALDAEQHDSAIDKLRAKLLSMSSQRERGQGYGSGTAVPPTDKPMSSDEARQLQAQVATMFFNS